jgi:hypothetical protein
MAGIASNPVSVNQSKQYGDQKQLDKLKSGLTTTPMTGVPIPASTAGRPPTRGGGPSPASASGAGPQATANIPPEHQQAMSEFATATRVKQYWDTIAAQYPSSWSRMYAADADENYQRIAHELRANTPFFSGA